MASRRVADLKPGAFERHRVAAAGLDLAAHRQVGIDATVAESGSLPRSDVVDRFRRRAANAIQTFSA